MLEMSELRPGDCAKWLDILVLVVKEVYDIIVPSRRRLPEDVVVALASGGKADERNPQLRKLWAQEDSEKRPEKTPNL